MLSRLRQPRDEDGLTLIELLITIVILGGAVVTMTGALTSLLLATQHHRGQGVTDTVARNFGEDVKKKAKLATTYTQCPTKADLTPTFTAFDPAVVSMPVIQDPIEYWIPSLVDPTQGEFKSDRNLCLAKYAACDATQIECDPGLQRVTYTVTAASGSLRGAATTVQVLTRRGNANA